MKLKDWFNDPSRWVQGTYARNAEGEAVSPRSEAAVCTCLAGGIDKIYWDKGSEIYVKAMNHLGIDVLSIWNDSPDRKFEDVQQLCVTLDI